MRGLKKAHYCRETVDVILGNEVTVVGWVQRSHDKGGVVFINLRDHSGILQLVFEEGGCGEEVFHRARSLESEYYITVGRRLERHPDPSPKFPTDELEVWAKTLHILSESETPPFPIEEDTKTREELRLKCRLLNLHRPSLQARIILCSKTATGIRHFMTSEGLFETEIPTLTKSTPEGTHDYLVPSHVHPGSVYALPQSSQPLKQFLMCPGYDRYFQLMRRYRGEGLRTDRRPEFMQINMELSSVNADDALVVNEKLLHTVLKEMLGVEVKLPIQRTAQRETMGHYDSDKPDFCFDMEITDASEMVKGCEFAVFSDALSAGDSVRGLDAKGQGHMSWEKIDALVEYTKDYSAKGLTYVTIREDGGTRSSFIKLLKKEGIRTLIKATGGENGGLLFFVTDKNGIVFGVLNTLRLELGRQLELFDKNEFRLVWITELSFLEWSEGEQRFKAIHHPFTMPMEEDWDKIDNGPGMIRAGTYDIILNGNEIGGGSARIRYSDIREKMLEAPGLMREVAEERFDSLFKAFRHDVPPHAGPAYGLDRLAMLMAGADTIRDVIAFPKVKDVSDLTMNVPDVVEEKQMGELPLCFRKNKA